MTKQQFNKLKIGDLVCHNHTRADRSLLGIVTDVTVADWAGICQLYQVRKRTVTVLWMPSAGAVGHFSEDFTYELLALLDVSIVA